MEPLRRGAAEKTVSGGKASANEDLISVVVPTYNQAKYLPICLDSIWFQDYPQLEIIVVNAASPDNTKEVLEEYQRSLKEDIVSFARFFNEQSGEVERFSHPRFPEQGRTLKVINLEKDPGLCETYNTGIRESCGKFIAPIVSDDIAHPMMISSLAAALDRGYDFAYSDLLIVDDVGRVVRKFEFPDYDPRICLADWYLMGVSRMWRRELHDKVGYFDSAIPVVHDYDLVLRFAMAGAKFIHVNKVLYSIRHHGADRKTGNHTSEREPRILTDSKEIALRARKWLGV